MSQVCLVDDVHCLCIRQHICATTTPFGTLEWHASHCGAPGRADSLPPQHRSRRRDHHRHRRHDVPDTTTKNACPLLTIKFVARSAEHHVGSCCQTLAKLNSKEGDHAPYPVHTLRWVSLSLQLCTASVGHLHSESVIKQASITTVVAAHRHRGFYHPDQASKRTASCSFCTGGCQCGFSIATILTDTHDRYRYDNRLPRRAGAAMWYGGWGVA